MKNIAIIPAREESKRLLNKNILTLDDRPLFLHSVEYALSQLDIIDKVVVSTDSAAIKDLALKMNIEVIDRPKYLSGDLSPTVDTLRHVIDCIETDFDNVVLLQPTNPLRPKGLLKEAYFKFVDGNYDSLMTVTRNNDKLGKIEDDKFIPYNYTFGQRSQELEPLYFENGLLYISKTSLIMENKILGDNNFPYIVDHPYANVDIDTDEDLNFAQYILENYPDE